MIPTTLRQLPEAVAPRDDDLFPVSQYNPDTNMSTTVGMRRDALFADVIEAVNEARADLVADFTAQNEQLQTAVQALQMHDGMIDGAITQINAIDTALQQTITEMGDKVSHPIQWTEIQGKPATFPAAATGWVDIIGKPASFPPSAHSHAISEVTGLQTALDGKLSGPISIGSPNVFTPTFGTAYQAANPAKPSFISAMIDTAYTVTVASTLADTVELRIGPNQTQVAAGTGGFVAATFRASLTGIALVIGLGMGQRNQLTAMLPVGWWFALRRTQGTNATITSATEQPLG